MRIIRSIIAIITSTLIFGDSRWFVPRASISNACAALKLQWRATKKTGKILPRRHDLGEKEAGNIRSILADDAKRHLARMARRQARFSMVGAKRRKKRFQKKTIRN